jgi:predicted nuclease of predicted toxin-antitoxin system
VKIKVDENIGTSGVAILKAASNDVMTVREQGLEGSADDRIYQACLDEGRVLVTLDRDFGHVPRFPPGRTAGIVVLQLTGAATLSQVQGRLQDFLSLAESRPVDGELWIVEPGRVRVHLEKDAE